MTNTHEKTLAAYMDLGSIYSYGYGALRQRYQSFHDNLVDAEELLEGFEQIISAVEFRSAELQARRLMEGVTVAVVQSEAFFRQPVAAPTAIYETPQGADGIARDQ